MRGAFFAIAAMFVLSGCGYQPEEIADAQSITLRRAVFDVADTLEAVKQHTKNRDKVGLYVDEAQVTFNVAAKATDTSDLKLGASAPAGFVPINASAEFNNASEGDRGNQITITFKNAATLGKGSPPTAMNHKSASGKSSLHQSASNGGSSAIPQIVVVRPGQPPIIVRADKIADKITDPELKQQIDAALNAAAKK